MKTVAIEDLMANTIVSFCENAAELGCPRDKDVDMWFRELTDKQRYDVMGKLIDIEERDSKMSQTIVRKCCFCGQIDENVEIANTSTPMHRRCLQLAALGGLEESLFDDNHIGMKPETSILMKDGSIKNVKDVGVGDIVMDESGDGKEVNQMFDRKSRTYMEEIEDESKDIIMKEIELDLDVDVIEWVINYARSLMVNDRQALINYGINHILQKVVDTEGACLGNSSKFNRFEVFKKEIIDRQFEDKDAFDFEYEKHKGYGVVGSYDCGSKTGIIWSNLNTCEQLNREGYHNKGFCNGGDDDILVVDHENKEYGFFEDNAPTEEQMRTATSLRDLWIMYY